MQAYEQISASETATSRKATKKVKLNTEKTERQDKPMKAELKVACRSQCGSTENSYE